MMLQPPAVTECNSIDKLTCNMETDEQPTPTPTISVNKIQSIPDKTQKVLPIVIFDQKWWMVSR